MKNKPKLLLVGWDAADWSIIQPLLSQGKLPALAEVIDNGFHGKLASLQPMLSPLLWTSIATGVRPHEHGVLNFVEVDESNEIRAVRGSSRRYPAFWEILKESGVNSNIIGWWPSHPAEDAGGISVSNFFTRSSDEQLDPLPIGSVYPASEEATMDELRVHVSEITARILAPFFSDVEEISGSDSVVSGVARIIAQTSSIHAAATEAMAREDWDITAVYYDAIDHFKHLAMAYHPPQNDSVSDDDFEKYNKVVVAGYRFHDMMLDRLLDLAGEDCHILLVSDHGFATGKERMNSIPEIPGGPALEHHPYGVIVGAGPQWKSQQIFGHSLLDICPAILHLFEQPISKKMTGRVPQEWWNDSRSFNTIDRSDWQPRTSVSSESGSKEMLADLERIGYIDLPKNHGEAVLQVLGDTRFNSIVSMLDGGLWQSAWTESKRLVHDYPNSPRYAYQHLGIALVVSPGEYEDLLRNTIDRFPSATGEYYLGLHALKHGFHEKALEHFQAILKSISLSPALAIAVGRTWIQAGRFEDALNWLLPIHDQYERWPETSYLLSSVYGDEKYEGFMVERALDYALEAVRRRYFYPEAHLQIARLAYRMEEWNAASTAYQVYLQMAPDHKQVLSELADSLEKMGKWKEAIAWRHHQENETPTLIVTGWPRSGTSMMMQVLNALGIEVYTDDERSSDESNPKGYFETEEVKKLSYDSSWMDKATGKALKIVVPHLQFLPGDRNYVVIWMSRPTTEIILSQEKMLGKEESEIKKYFPFAKAMQIERDGAEAKRRLEEMGNVKLMEVEFEDCILQSKSVVEMLCNQLRNFPGMQSSKIESALNQIDAGLYRSRL
ncbi:MAG: alkaline phosphatase family protein [Flavobacteriia bacterium]|nr:alkaline phosphatase family protein [Flavobacteriia bacterium]